MTEQEKQELLEEAKRRGFVEGATFVSNYGVDSGREITIKSEISLTTGEVWGLYYMNAWINLKGEWATITTPAPNTVTNYPIFN